MSQRQTVVYTARTSQEAHLLRNLLAEMRIEALVVNDLLERGSGVGMAGWPTAARVVVAEDDAPRARTVALEFDRQAASAVASPAVEEEQMEEASAVIDAWPTCPKCDARRSTRCQICGTAGSDFAPADMGFLWIPEPEATGGGSACGSCGPGGCTPTAGAAAAPTADEEGPETPTHLWMCPTCDEPFAPQFPRVCEWCGHEFEDGYEVDLPQPPLEQINRRMVAVIVGLLAMAAAMVGYLMFAV